MLLRIYASGRLEMYIPLLLTKTCLKESGRIADYCPLCLEIRSFKYTEHYDKILLFWVIPVQPSTNNTYVIACEKCGLARNTSPDSYSAISKAEQPGLESLIAETNPTIREKHAAQLDLIGRARANQLSPNERYEFIRGLFSFLNETLMRGFGPKEQLKFFDSGCLFWALPVVVALAIKVTWFPDNEKFMPLAILSIIVIGILSTGFAILTAKKSLKLNVLPYLVQGLLPLKPTHSELTEVLSELERIGYKIATEVSADEVLTALAKQKDASQ